MNGYLKMPKVVACAECGKKKSIKLIAKKRLPPGVDAIGFSRCSNCKTQSVHFAGQVDAIQKVAQDFMSFKAEKSGESPVSTFLSLL
jgi:ribosomal protein L32